MKAKKRELGFKRKRLALLISTTIAQGAAAPYLYAQEEAEEKKPIQLEEIIVEGIRGSLLDARNIKRNADTFVDSIASSDISTLPDLSVAEALQRVPGVTVTRIALGGASGDFPSPEGSGNLIRGLSFVRSEFNGRDAFSANGGRSLDWSSVPPELVGGVDVYKNQSADLIEGGIGGTINLRTLEPFDRDGMTAVVIADGTYTDLREDTSPSYSGIFGNRWKLSSGDEVGIMASISSSELNSGINGFQVGHPIATTQADGSTVAVPSGVQLRTNEVDRERDSYYFAAQWRDEESDFQATFKYARVENSSERNERTTDYFAEGGAVGGQRTVGDINVVPFTSEGVPLCNGNSETSPGSCEALTPIDGGLFESGVITNSADSWFGAQGNPVTNLGIYGYEESMTQDVSLNLKWRPADRWYLSFDAHKTDAEANSHSLWAGSRTYADIFLRPDLENPAVRYDINPAHSVADFAFAGSGFQTPTSLNDPAATFLLFSADDFKEGEGDLVALRADAEYEFEDSDWFESVKFGARYSERDQVNRQADLNWAATAAPWAGGYAPYSGFSGDAFELVDFADFFRGGVVQGDNTEFVYASRDLLQNYQQWAQFVESQASLGNRDWRPLADANGVVNYQPDQISDIVEETQNLYVRLDFGNDFANGTSIDGNFGVRYVKTDISSAGSISFDAFAEDVDESMLPVDDPNYRSPEVEAIDNVRDFLPETAAFLDQASRDLTLSSSESFLLPSFNLKWNLNDEMLVRFGISKALTRPNVQDVRAAQSVSQAVTIVTPDPLPPGDPNADEPRGFVDVLLGSQRIFGGNPDLMPTEAVNWDLSFEWYYGTDSSFTASVFGKELENMIIFSEETRQPVTLDGQTVETIYTGLVNQDSGDILGLELAYQHFFDNLPGLFSNLGVQMNYTYIDASVAAPPAFRDTDGDGQIDPGSFANTFRYGLDNLLGQSEDTVNLVGIYQDDKFEMRLAYNWRSEYLISYRDVVTGNPIFQDSAGFLDGSFKYDINDNLQLRLLAANILDTKSKSSQQIDQAGQRLPRSSFLNDRRFVLGLRYQF